MALFKQLHKYRNVNKTSLEDFITELWVDILNRLPEDRILKFCTEFLLSDCTNNELIPRWSNRVQAIKGRLVWRTQVQILVEKYGMKRPDIILFKGDFPIMIIENKIGASFTQYENYSLNNKMTSIDQMSLYSKWISENGKCNETTALVLMTHLTSPPEGFLERNSSDPTQLRSVARWPNFYEWLNSEQKRFWVGTEPNAELLLNEFITFLEEMNMTTDEPSASDFAAARLFLGGNTYTRIQTALRAARLIMTNTYKKIELKEGKRESIKLESYDAEGWIYERCTFPSGAWVQWGFWFGEGRESFWQPTAYDPPVIPGDYAVVWVYPENRIILRPEPNTFPEWHFPCREEDDQWTIPTLRPLHALMASPDGFTSAYSTWIQKKFEEAADLLKLDR